MKKKKEKRQKECRKERKKDRKMVGRTDGWTDGQTIDQTKDRQKDRQTDRKTDRNRGLTSWFSRNSRPYFREQMFRPGIRKEKIKLPVLVLENGNEKIMVLNVNKG